ncbi:hypothetical protein AHF37_10317 [Paragonimus kellicotti]|nr:hypothetical protein AHF37_10317 [Paragonimus kellicotti]
MKSLRLSMNCPCVIIEVNDLRAEFCHDAKLIGMKYAQYAHLPKTKVNRQNVEVQVDLCGMCFAPPEIVTPPLFSPYSK